MVYLGVFDDAGSLRGRRLHMIPSFQRLVIEDFEEIEKKVQLATSEICARSEDLELVGKAINISHGFLFYKKLTFAGSGWRLIGFYACDLSITYVRPSQ